jgi:hypothetical protein
MNSSPLFRANFCSLRTEDLVDVFCRRWYSFLGKLDLVAVAAAFRAAIFFFPLENSLIVIPSSAAETARICHRPKAAEKSPVVIPSNARDLLFLRLITAVARKPLTWAGADAPNVGFTRGPLTLICSSRNVCQFTNPFGIRTSRKTRVNLLE